MRRRVRLGVVVLISLVLVICAAGLANGQSKEFKEAMAVAKANAQTPEGKAYRDKIEKEFQQEFLPTVQRCQRLLKKEWEGVGILIRLANDGSAEEVLTDSKTKVASCFRQDVLSYKFTPPPKPSYWVYFAVALSK